MTTETQNVTEELKDFAESAEKAGLTSGDRVIGRAIARIAELEAVVELVLENDMECHKTAQELGGYVLDVNVRTALEAAQEATNDPN